jgi:hypothetical protein
MDRFGVPYGQNRRDKQEYERPIPVRNRKHEQAPREGWERIELASGSARALRLYGSPDVDGTGKADEVTGRLAPYRFEKDPYSKWLISTNLSFRD